MGRYCSGDIDHKFWVAVQASDARWLGGEESFLIANQKETEDGNIEYLDDIVVPANDASDDKLRQAYASRYLFSHSNIKIDELKKRIDELNLKIKNTKVKEISLDTYPEKIYDLSEELYSDLIASKQGKAFLNLMAEVQLGLRIYQCVKKQGSCLFDAEF